MCYSCVCQDIAEYLNIAGNISLQLSFFFGLNMSDFYFSIVIEKLIFQKVLCKGGNCDFVFHSQGYLQACLVISE